MNSSAQYAALTRLLTLNNRVHDLQELQRQMPVRLGYVTLADFLEEGPESPFAQLQDEIDREARASLVTCWLAMPDPDYGQP
jgi:hypothetical protein